MKKAKAKKTRKGDVGERKGKANAHVKAGNKAKSRKPKK